MKKTPILFLQVLMILIGISVLILMLWEPHIEGRNTHAALFEIYFKDPFLAYAYIASLPFFMGLFQVYKLLGHIGQNKVFSQKSIESLKIIKYCAIFIIIFVVIAEIFIIFTESDDRAGGVFMGILVALGSIVIINIAVVFEGILHKAINLTSKNNLND
jgi:hypothetical protein